MLTRLKISQLMSHHYSCLYPLIDDKNSNINAQRMSRLLLVACSREGESGGDVAATLSLTAYNNNNIKNTNKLLLLLLVCFNYCLGLS